MKKIFEVTTRAGKYKLLAYHNETNNLYNLEEWANGSLVGEMNDCTKDQLTEIIGDLIKEVLQSNKVNYKVKINHLDQRIK